MKLHWSPKSPYVRKVMIAAHELGCVHEIELIRSVASMKSTNPSIMRDNPLNKIPTLVLDDGRALFDSLVICEYLDRRHGGNVLFPLDIVAWSEAVVRHALADGVLDLLILWRNERDREPGRQSPEFLSAYQTKVKAGLERIDASTPTVCGERIDIGDIAQGCALAYADYRFPELEWRQDHPRLAEWQSSFAARPAAIATEIREG